ncbi:MAG: tyrosine--tRNA ligase [Bacteroidetes bacterium GWF2_38_335]|nr:MAG: tyrosine--tRNA ligase [Bacteroidetes bacterium GWF2_38_335]OFY78457.1 MAG: tyrosine--tRNA ligase [Bacteroidetes bacterium RIFOXYA12_FULL_38_20]HBS88403.1 tyrosine--tRNA ligase [Bacteroidales bacterium]
MNFIEELRWRGMIHDIMPGTEEQMKKEMTSGYIGFDPTADSLHIGSLVQIMILVHLQKSGHKPFALVGGATGMVGDPSGKSKERNLLTREIIEANLNGVKKQLEKFLDFNCGANSAEIVDNYQWFENFSFLDFIRDVGKHITVNYMMSKDSVQKRLESGMSFTEFSYQLVQGYDFYWLYKNKNCKLQLGGSDQWGNIVTGTELIRRKDGGEAFAVTSPLIKKADGSKFGKTEEGNIWLDKDRTSPYKFYQYWINSADDDVKNYIRIFTLKTKEEIDALIETHDKEPHMRILQKELAKEVTTMVHSKEDYESALEASEILFGKGTTETLSKIDESTFLSIFEGVPVFDIEFNSLRSGINILDLLTEKASVFPSKGELRRTIQGGGVNLNKQKIESAEMTVNETFLMNKKYMLVQKGKKNNFIIRAI